MKILLASQWVNFSLKIVASKKLNDEITIDLNKFRNSFRLEGCWIKKIDTALFSR